MAYRFLPTCQARIVTGHCPVKLNSTMIAFDA